MATQVGTTTVFNATKATGVTTYTVLFTPDGVTGTPRAATVGNKIMLCAFGGATITAKITNSSGASFTSRGQASSTQAVSIHEYTAVGGETQAFITLNGAENVSVAIMEYNGAGTFIAASTATLTVAQSGNWQAKPSTAVTVPGNALLIAAWSIAEASTTAPFSTANQWRQMGPYGKLIAGWGNQPGANSQYIAAVGVADVTATGSWPPSNPAGQYQATSMWNQNSNTAWCVQVAFTDTSGVATVPAVANPVAGENTLPGNDQANWYLGKNSANSAIAMYSDVMSVQPGQTINFKVDDGNLAHTVEILRAGWYGWESTGARTVATLTGSPTTQPAPTVDAALGSTSCAWTTTASWTVPAGAVPGVYLARAWQTATPANQTLMHFVVRPTSVAGKIVVVLPTFTYAAYSVWGATGDHGDYSTGTWTGRSLYRAGSDGGTGNSAHRAYAVSFDRPSSTASAQPNTSFWDSEHGLITFLEAQGYDLTYVTDTDLDNDTSLLTSARLVLMVGHSEYWTQNVYDAYLNAVNAGVNLMVASSNVALWHTRFDPGDTNKRTMICYKESLTVDVGAGWSGTGRDPGGYTGTWRDIRTATAPNNPLVRREAALTGQMFAVNASAAHQLTVAYAQKGLPIWRGSTAIQALTTGQSYTTTPAVYGDEGDLPGQASAAGDEPANMVALCPTAVSYASQGSNINGSVYTAAVSGNAGFTLYRRASGALVLHIGGWRGWWGVSRWAGSTLGSGGVTAVDVNWQQALLSILYDLGAMPAAITALRPGTDTALTDPSVGTPTGSRNAIAAAYGLQVSGSTPVWRGSSARGKGRGVSPQRYPRAPRPSRRWF